MMTRHTIAFRRPVVWLAVSVVTAAAAGMLIFGALNYRVYTIHTGSMTPTIPIGSAVVVRRGPVRVGEVITFRPHGATAVVTHRLVGIYSDGTLMTKGDGNNAPDADDVTRADVVGRVVAAPQHVGAWLEFAFHSKPGVVFDGLFLVILTSLLSISGTDDSGTGEAAKVSHRPSHRAVSARGKIGPTGSSRSLRSRSSTRWGHGRQGDREGRPNALTGLEPYPATMLVDDAFCDRQP
jgi:signal peptidase I